MKIRLWIIISLTAVLFTACTSVRQMTLLGEVQPQYTLPEQPEFVLAENDVLYISFSSINQDAVAAYHTNGHEFVIDRDGTILLPVLGRITVKGKTEKQVAEMLTQAVGRYLKDPIVKVELKNATVAVLGEVKNQHQIGMPCPMPLLNIIASAGGFTRNARRDNILVQRVENGKVKHYRVNLLTDELFSSPCYYLQKGDIVYVSPLHPAKSQ